MWQLCTQMRCPSYLQLHFMALLVKSLSATSKLGLITTCGALTVRSLPQLHRVGLPSCAGYGECAGELQLMWRSGPVPVHHVPMCSAAQSWKTHVAACLSSPAHLWAQGQALSHASTPTSPTELVGDRDGWLKCVEG